MDEKKTLDELLGIMHEHDLDAIKVKMDGQIYELVRREAGAAAPAGPSAPQPGAPVAPGTAAAAPAASPNVKKVTAPLVGVFYQQPSPDSEPFVTVGERVEVGQVICILEAMKLFNEITTDHAGVVTRIIPENGELVSLGQEMFWIEP